MGIVASSSLMTKLCRASSDTHSLLCSEFDDEGLFEKMMVEGIFSTSAILNTFVASCSYKKLLNERISCLLKLLFNLQENTLKLIKNHLSLSAYLRHGFQNEWCHANF